MMHHFSYDGICLSCDEQSHLNDQHMCAGCFAKATLPYANDNRNDTMSPWGAPLFNCFRSSNPMEQKKALDDLSHAILEKMQ